MFFMANLFAMRCTTGGRRPMQPDEIVKERFKSLPDSLREIVNQMHVKSPQAQVIFDNYLTVLAEQGTCARVALAVAQADLMRSVAARLADITAPWHNKPARVCST
jgi:hypothetical protein